MTEPASSSRPTRPEFRNIHAFKDLPSYRWPLAALVSGMHRFSGLLMLLLLPFIIWMFDASVTSDYSYTRFTAAFTAGIGFAPGWLVKLAALALIWAYLHHVIAGLRHLGMEIAHAVSKETGRRTAAVTLAVSLSLTAVLGAKLFGLY